MGGHAVGAAPPLHAAACAARERTRMHSQRQDGSLGNFRGFPKTRTDNLATDTFFLPNFLRGSNPCPLDGHARTTF